MPAPRLSIHELLPQEAAMLNPARWDGHSAGVGERLPYPAVHLGLRGAAKVAKKVWQAEAALTKLQQNPNLAQYSTIFEPGSQFWPGVCREVPVMFDHEMLLTRGRYSLELEGFPGVEPLVPSRIGDPYYAETPRLRYLRQMAPLAWLDETSPVAVTKMEQHVGLRDYPQQVGTLAVSQVVAPGAVQHYTLSDGQEMITRIRAVHVLPS